MEMSDAQARIEELEQLVEKLADGLDTMAWLHAELSYAIKQAVAHQAARQFIAQQMGSPLPQQQGGQLPPDIQEQLRAALIEKLQQKV